MSGFDPALLRRGVLVCALIKIYAVPALAQEPPAQVTDPFVRSAIELWNEGTVRSELRALDRLSRRVDLATPAIRLVIPGLKNPDAEVRARVARVLGEIGPPAAGLAIPALTDALDDQDDQVCEAAASAIGRFGARASEALPCLVRCIRSGRIGRGSAGQVALARIADPAVSTLVALLKDNDSSVRLAAASALGELVREPKIVIPALIEAARDSSRTDRAAILAALSGFGSEVVVPLARSLSGGDAQYRADAALALASLGDQAEAAIPILIECLKDPKLSSFILEARKNSALSFQGPEVDVDRNEIDDVLIALGVLAVPALCERLEFPDACLQMRASRILGLIGPAAAESVPALERLLGNRDLRIEAADALERISPTERDDAHSLFAALKDRRPLFRARAAAVLGRIAEKQIAEKHTTAARRIHRFLIAATRDPDAGVRAASVRAAGSIEAQLSDHWLGLASLLDDSAGEVRAAAVRAIARIKYDGATTARRASLLEDADERVRVEAADSMDDQDMRSVVVLTGLIKSLGDASAGVRAAAARRLADAGDWMKHLEGADSRLTRARVVRAIRLAFSDTDPRVRTAAARLLPRFKLEAIDSHSLLVAQTKDDSFDARCAAVLALTELASAGKDSMLPLIDLLSDQRPQGADGGPGARLAADALMSIGGEAESAMFERLISQLASSDLGLRRMSSRLLYALGQESVPSLARILADSKTHRSLRIRVMSALTGLEAGAQAKIDFSSQRRLPELRPLLPMLKTMVHTEDSLMRLHAFTLICAIDRDPGLINESYLAASREQDPAAMINLDGLFGIADTPALLVALKDPDPDVRTSTVFALVGIASELSDQEVQLRDGGGGETDSAGVAKLQVLHRRKSEIVRALESSLDDSDSQVRWAAVKAFEMLRSDIPRVFDRLVDLARDTRTRVRRGATIWLLNLVNENAEEEFRRGVDEKLRIAAIETLASDEFHRPIVVSILIGALNDSDSLTRLHATSALGRMGECAKEAVPALIELLRANMAPVDGVSSAVTESDDLSVPIKMSVIETLGAMGPDGGLAVPVLTALLSDPVPAVREHAANLLFELGPRAASAISEEAGAQTVPVCDNRGE